MRLKSVRNARGLSLREFAKKVGENFTLLARIEAGERYPPKPRLEKFARVLALTPPQLEALIAVERRGLNPYELLPEITPAHIPQKHIEAAADKILRNYCRAASKADIEHPVPVVDVIKVACGLST